MGIISCNLHLFTINIWQMSGVIGYRFFRLSRSQVIYFNFALRSTCPSLSAISPRTFSSLKKICIRDRTLTINLLCFCKTGCSADVLLRVWCSAHITPSLSLPSPLRFLSLLTLLSNEAEIPLKAGFWKLMSSFHFPHIAELIQCCTLSTHHVRACHPSPGSPTTQPY